MAIKKRPVSPRQKMINLMYVVLMAMLALNVSTEVLNGFSIVEESLKRTTSNATLENMAIYDDFAVQMKKNPQKVKEWYDKSQQVKQMSAHLYDLADELKHAIVVEADGKDGDVRNIRNKEDLEAANQVMLAPGRGRGKELYDAINTYRVNMLKMVTTPRQKKLLISTLTTEIPKVPRQWVRTGRSICLRRCLLQLLLPCFQNFRVTCAMRRARCCIPWYRISM